MFMTYFLGGLPTAESDLTLFEEGPGQEHSIWCVPKDFDRRHRV